MNCLIGLFKSSISLVMFFILLWCWCWNLMRLYLWVCIILCSVLLVFTLCILKLCYWIYKYSWFLDSLDELTAGIIILIWNKLWKILKWSLQLASGFIVCILTYHILSSCYIVHLTYKNYTLYWGKFQTWCYFKYAINSIIYY